jgi:gliding motility-associated-like protein
MTKLLSMLTMWLIVNQLATAQNLVANGDFEQSSKNPCRFISDSKVNISDYLADWRSPTKGTSDPWYTSDTITDYCTQNLKGIGYLAHSGTRCAGIYTAAITNRVLLPSDGPNYREYLQTKLRKPLQKGRSYTVEAYCRRHQYAGTITNNIGFYFSVGSTNVTMNSSLLLPVKPQINIEQPIDSFKEWVKIGGCFIADDNYDYLTIGNFFDDNHTLFQTGSLPNRGDYPYYLLDDVVVKETPVDKLPRAHFLGADSTLCPQQILTIRLLDVPQVTYKWQDGSDVLNYAISRSGSYSVVAQLDQCVVKDTINVVIEKSFRLPADTTLCNAEQLVIRPTSHDARAIWSNGSGDSTLTISETGLYWLRVPTSHCNLADSIRVGFVGCNPFIPNVFTPNGDGKNDFFVIDPDNDKRIEWHIIILNRWGGKVYEANPYRNDWDGGNLPSAVYYYLLDNRQYNRQVKGWVTVYR